MGAIIRTVELGKCYRISHQHGVVQPMLREVMVELLRRRCRPAGSQPEIFWALRDVSVEIERGEQVALIGGNGAGKSTLLKLLSRITSPSEGNFTISGRVSNLLEVGAGFHHELTGRENIYLSGAICGMRREEVADRFDDIVFFAGTEKFLDIPVKRYSAGMRARLAFSIAVHLGSDVLILDEILAVGDVHFQRAFVDKLKELARAGATLLFVSHDPAVVRALCSRAVLFDKGRVVLDGKMEFVLEEYLRRSPMMESGLSR